MNEKEQEGKKRAKGRGEGREKGEGEGQARRRNRKGGVGEGGERTTRDKQKCPHDKDGPFRISSTVCYVFWDITLCYLV